MADDRIDWCDVAAVGVIADVLSTSASRGPVASLLEDLRREWCRDFRGGFTRDVGKAASALREAIEIMSAELDRLRGEVRDLNRAMAARDVIDGWCEDEEGTVRKEGGALVAMVRKGPVGESWYEEVASAPDYPALAAALGLEVEDE